MKPEYQAWIQEHYPTYKEAYGSCNEASHAMKEAFPELTIVPGHVYCSWGKRDHIWLTDPEGNIVDPTALQYQGTVSRYEPWKPGDAVRVGKCMNCGSDIYANLQSLDGPAGRDTSICDAECAADFERYLQAEVNRYGRR